MLDSNTCVALQTVESYSEASKCVKKSFDISNRSVLSALFKKGCLENSLATTYSAMGLVSVDTLLELSQEVLTTYITSMGIPALGFEGWVLYTNQWNNLWEQLQNRDPQWLLEMVRLSAPPKSKYRGQWTFGPLEGTRKLFEIAVDIVPPELWTSQDVLKVVDTGLTKTFIRNLTPQTRLDVFGVSKTLDESPTLLDPTTQSTQLQDVKALEGFLKDPSKSIEYKTCVVGNLPDTYSQQAWESIQHPTAKACLLETAPHSAYANLYPQIMVSFVETMKKDKNFSKRDTLSKATMVRRSDPTQCLELFKYFSKVQKTFGPKVQEEFLIQLDDNTFKTLLVEFVLSKKFSVRNKKFTLEMLPLVLKLDVPEVTAKFNQSSAFKVSRIGNLVEFWATLTTQQAKQTWLDETPDVKIREKLLKELISKELSIQAPIDRKFNIGTTDPVAVATILEFFSTSVSTVTHAEFLKVALTRCSSLDVEKFLLNNPLDIFSMELSSSDVDKNPAQINPVSDAEYKRVAENLLGKKQK